MSKKPWHQVTLGEAITSKNWLVKTGGWALAIVGGTLLLLYLSFLLVPAIVYSLFALVFLGHTWDDAFVSFYDKAFRIIE